MKLDITNQERELFEVIHTAADYLQQDVYVVGGFVRDRILGIPCKDLDFVTVGDGPALAEEVSRRLGAAASDLSVFKTFGARICRSKERILQHRQPET